MALTIRKVRPILTAPDGINLVVVKVETSEPGLHGLGCATHSYRNLSVANVVENYLDPLLHGRPCGEIEELFQLMTLNAYWRNGPIQNSAISGVDMALWDIKARLAGMPLYDLLGGKCREAAAIYRHADGVELSALEDNVRALREAGVNHVRIQRGGYGGTHGVNQGQVKAVGFGEPPPGAGHPDGAKRGVYYNPKVYCRRTIEALEHIRNVFGPELELLHDVHERLAPADALSYARELEPFKLFFLEDLFAPEDIEWFERARQLCATPLATGELFNHPLEWTPLIAGRKIDFMRMHISQMGGLTPARKAAILGETFGVRTAWHGPGDLSPVGHALNLHLDLCSPNFGIQEFTPFQKGCQEVFPGYPTVKDGYLYPNDKPGLGIDIDEAAAERFPCQHGETDWTQLRRPDGSLQRP